MKRNTILTFICSLIPGAGQMYQGYMKRGLSLVLIFMLPLFVGYFLPPVIAFAAVAYMYSFFDSMNLHSRLKETGAVTYTEPEDDEFVVHLDWLEQSELKTLLDGRHHLLGWALIAAGVAALYQSLIRPILEAILETMHFEGPAANAIWSIMHRLPNLVMAGVLVCGGLWLIRGPKKKEPEEEYKEYRGQDDD